MAVGVAATWNDDVALAVMCAPPASVIWAATTVAVHDAKDANGVVGVRVKVVAGWAVLVDRAKALGVPAGHSRVKAEPVALTASEKVTTTVELAGTSVAPLAGTMPAVGGTLTVLVIVLVVQVGVAQ